MNLSLISLEIGVALLGVLVLLAGLWTPPHRRPVLGICTALGLTVILALLVKQGLSVEPLTDSSGGFVRDGLAMFFKALFLLAGILVTLLTMGFANRLRSYLLKDNTPDTGCGLKLIEREAFLRLPYFDHMHRFIPALIQRHQGGMRVHPVNHRPRSAGVSKYGNLDRALVGILDLFGVWWLIRRTRFNASPRELEI